MDTEKRAFTLSEILITIGIIGVVAALTIPTLIQNSNSKKFVNHFKKLLSTLNQAAIGAHAQYDMDYSLLSSINADSSCANDTLAGGQYTLCGLLNNTLAGHTYVGKYGSVKGANGSTSYTATVKSFSINNFLFFSFSDGAFVAFNPNATGCGVGVGQVITTEMLTDGKLKNCLGFIDVNGPTPPNTEISCAEGTTVISANTTCKVTNASMGDIFPIVFHDGSVEPATNASLSAFLGGNGKEVKDDESDEVAAPIKKILFKGKEYEYKNGKYITEDANGNYVDGMGNVYTKNSDGNYVGNDQNVYDKDMNVIGQTKNGYWFDYKGDVYVRPIENGKYKGQGGMTYTPTSDGNYNRSDGAVLDSNFNILGQNKNNSWYDYKNGFFVKEDSNGNYVDSSGKVYEKNSDGNYVNNNTYYDKDMNIVGEYYNGYWFDNKGGLFVRETGDGTYKGHSMTYTKNEDGFYVRSDRNVYDEDFNLIGR